MMTLGFFQAVHMQWLPLSITLNDRYDLLMLFLVGHFDNVL